MPPNAVVEMFRGLAALMVFTSHSANLFSSSQQYFRFLWTGVDLFFVVSGFVFAPIFLGGRFCLRGFLIRRAFRIVPLYVASLAIYYAITPEDPHRFYYLFKHLLFLHTTASPTEAFFFNPVYWSLPVEVEFYFLVPLFAAIVHGRVRILNWLMLAAILGRFLIISHASPFGISQPNLMGIVKIHIPGIIIEFLIGIFAYLAVQHGSAKLSRAHTYLCFGCGILLWTVLGLYFGAVGDQGINSSVILRSYFSPMCAFSYGVILTSSIILVQRPYPQAQRYMAIAGRLSYGTYLFHYLVLHFFESFVSPRPGLLGYMSCLALVLCLAGAMNWLVEEPSRRYGRMLAAKWESASQAKTTP